MHPMLHQCQSMRLSDLQLAISGIVKGPSKTQMMQQLRMRHAPLSVAWVAEERTVVQREPSSPSAPRPAASSTGTSSVG